MEQIIFEVAIGLVNCLSGNNKLVFPKYYNNSKEENRISEQESKILFANELTKKNIRFSIEVPTKSKHKQKGKKLQSARFDLVTYKDKSFDFDWVIELKSKNPPIEHFEKDFEKMVLSETNCIWFHTLKNADEQTFNVLLEKINNGIKKYINNFVGKYIWKFALVVLEKGKLYLLDLLLEKGKFKNIDSINQFNKKDIIDVIKGRKK